MVKAGFSHLFNRTPFYSSYLKIYFGGCRYIRFSEAYKKLVNNYINEDFIGGTWPLQI